GDSQAAPWSPKRCSSPARPHRLPCCDFSTAFHSTSLISAGSTPLRCKNQVGGTVSGTHRTLNRCRQPGISPIAREKQVFPGCERPRPQRILPRRRLECGTALAHDLPCRQFTGDTGDVAHVPPDRQRELLARPVH